MFFDEVLIVRVRKIEKRLLGEQIKRHNLHYEDDQIDLSIYIRRQIMDNLKDKRGFFMTYNQDKAKATKEIDDLLTQNKSDNFIIATIERKYGFGETFFKRRKKLMADLALEAEQNPTPEVVDDEN